jgi:PAS domain S-box-containing protein
MNSIKKPPSIGTQYIPRKRLLRVFVLFTVTNLFFSLLSFSTVSQDESARAPEDISLSEAGGKDRIQILVELAQRYRNNDPRKSLAYGTEALELLRTHPEPSLQAIVQNYTATAHVGLGNFREAEKIARQVLNFSEKRGDQMGIALALNNLCLLGWNTGTLDRGMESGLRALEIFKSIQYPEGIAETLNNIGICYWRIGANKSALESFHKAVQLFRDLDNKTYLGNVHNNLGILHNSIGDRAEALEHYENARRIYESTGNQMGYAVVLNNIAMINIGLRKYKEAHENIKRGMELSKSLGTRSLDSTFLKTLSELYSAKKEYPRALEVLHDALEIQEKLNEAQNISISLVAIGNIKMQMGRMSEALPYVKRALTIAEKLNDKRTISFATNVLSRIYERQGNYSDALDAHKALKKVNDSIFNDENSRKISELQTRYRLEKKESEIFLLKKERELQAIEINRSQIVKISLLIIIALVFISAILFYTRYRLKLKSNRLLAGEVEEHKATAMKLKESEEKFRTVAEKSLVGIFILQEERFKYVNPTLSVLFGYAPGALAGKAPTVLAVPSFQEMLADNLNRLYSGETESLKFEFNGLNKDEEILFLECYGARVNYLDQPAVLGTVIDITHRKRTKAELIKSQKMESVGILAGSIADDFNKLLIELVGNLSSIPDAVKERHPLSDMFNSMDEATQRALELSNKLIMFSNGGWIMTQKLDLADLLQKTAQFHPEVEHLLRYPAIPPDLHPLHGDERKLREVLFNVLMNADEAMTAPKQLVLKAENIWFKQGNTFSLTQGRYVKISITDNGRGIPPDQLLRVFDPYFSTKDTFSQKGMGLGLAICYSVIQKHNGHISIQSELGKGTTVEIYLPAYRQ